MDLWTFSNIVSSIIINSLTLSYETTKQQSKLYMNGMSWKFRLGNGNSVLLVGRLSADQSGSWNVSEHHLETTQEWDKYQLKTTQGNIPLDK